ncbi:hypothetical protein tb265_26190 [Gemmatimonadetes bacterium T265]|nr:hypothetical protein tb265_26190 [Gemmatimonadetes bacterium T265]
MGGIFSTRWDGHARRAAVEEAPLRLAARDVKRAHGTLPADHAAEGVWGWPNGSTLGYALGAVDYAGRRTLTLTYALAPAPAPPAGRGRRPTGAPTPAADAVRVFLYVVAEPQRIGARVAGARWWFWCPFCDRKRAAVYLALSARYFRCRVCAGLTYLSRLGGPTGRADRACRKAARRLGVDYFDFGPCGWAPRPKGMRTATYARRLVALEAAHERRDALFLAGAARILARFPTQHLRPLRRA